MDIMNEMLTRCIDAGGPQGISQLLILKEVMERLSKDEIGDFQGIVKRPCEVFDVIGGVGTGGSVQSNSKFEMQWVFTASQVDCYFSGSTQNDGEGCPGRIHQVCRRGFQGRLQGPPQANREACEDDKWYS